MNVKSLLEKSQTAFVQSDTLSSAESIQYFHSNGTDETVKAFVDFFKKRDENSKTRFDEIVFSNVILAVPPKRKKDYIVYHGEELIIETWGLQNGMYVITTLSNEALKNRRK